MKELEFLKEILKEVDDIYLRKKIEEISTTDKLIDDLGLDSLGRMSLLHEINFKLKKETDESHLNKWVTVSDILDYVKVQI